MCPIKVRIPFLLYKAKPYQNKWSKKQKKINKAKQETKIKNGKPTNKKQSLKQKRK